jgi:hypothetical protein
VAVLSLLMAFRKFQSRTEGIDTWQYNHYIWRGGSSSTDWKEPIGYSATITFGVEANCAAFFELLILTRLRHFRCSGQRCSSDIMVPPILSVAVVILWLSQFLGKLCQQIGKWTRGSRCEGYILVCNCCVRYTRK